MLVVTEYVIDKRTTLDHMDNCIVGFFWVSYLGKD